MIAYTTAFIYSLPCHYSTLCYHIIHSISHTTPYLLNIMITYEVYDITYYKTSQGSVTAVTHFCRYTYHMLSYTSYDSSDSILLPKVGHVCFFHFHAKDQIKICRFEKKDFENPSIFDREKLIPLLCCATASDTTHEFEIS